MPSVILRFLTPLFVGGIAKAVLTVLGVGIVSYVGFSELLAYAFNEIKAHLGELPTSALNILGLLGVDQALNLIFSAYAIRVSMIVLKRFRII